MIKPRIYELLTGKDSNAWIKLPRKSYRYDPPPVITTHGELTMIKILTAIFATCFALSALAAYAPKVEGQAIGEQTISATEKQGQANEGMTLAAAKKAKKKHPKHA